ncbi:MAG: hypothetical protein IJI83_00085 [Oscillospiraceae bacterium]|nr:hypothetical protein [Oscillospiraceae bacterium]MBR3142258.1 hypothetical protein [Clostridiales bacterium]
MRNRKYHVYLTSEEKRLLLNALIDERNILIAHGMFTDAVDDLIIKITKAHRKWPLLSA